MHWVIAHVLQVLASKHVENHVKATEEGVEVREGALHYKLPWSSVVHFVTQHVPARSLRTVIKVLETVAGLADEEARRE